MAKTSKIALTLSGGGARAMAFHLGCLRALHDHGILDRISVLSSVSGGSVIAAMYAFSDEPFEEFDARVVKLLKTGLIRGIAKETLFSGEALKIIATLLTAGLCALLASLVGLLGNLTGFFGINRKWTDRAKRHIQVPFRRWASRTTAFENHLRKTVYGDLRMNEVKRPDLDVVINAAELRTGTAFRFGSIKSGSWRYGTIDGPVPYVSKAVAASAAFPLLLPALDEVYNFKKKDKVSRKRVIITDGGVYDNLGVTCVLPDRSPEYSTNVFDVDFIICCDAGQGLPTGADIPFFWASRMEATFSTTHRRTLSMSYDLLHKLAASGKIDGFLLPYLGQQDRQLPEKKPDLVQRDDVIDYPTDFNPMDVDNITLLSKRGEQLTRMLLTRYHPSL